MITYDEKIWELIDDKAGKTYRSRKTDVPVKWVRTASGMRDMTYTSGEYTIVRRPYGKAGHSYRLKRQGIELFGFYARLKYAKAHAQRNARGEEICHVA